MGFKTRLGTWGSAAWDGELLTPEKHASSRMLYLDKFGRCRGQTVSKQMHIIKYIALIANFSKSAFP